MSIRQWVRVWYRIGRDVGGPWMGVRNVTAGLRRHIREGGNWPTAAADRENRTGEGNRDE